jgi:hypothetical protein
VGVGDHRRQVDVGCGRRDRGDGASNRFDDEMRLGGDGTEDSADRVHWAADSAPAPRLPLAAPVYVFPTPVPRAEDHDSTHVETRAAVSLSNSASVVEAERVMRSRAVPLGTVGGRIAWTRIPSARSA